MDFNGFSWYEKWNFNCFVLFKEVVDKLAFDTDGWERGNVANNRPNIVEKFRKLSLE